MEKRRVNRGEIKNTNDPIIRLSSCDARIRSAHRRIVDDWRVFI